MGVGPLKFWGVVRGVSQYLRGDLGIDVPATTLFWQFWPAEMGQLKGLLFTPDGHWNGPLCSKKGWGQGHLRYKPAGTCRHTFDVFYRTFLLFTLQSGWLRKLNMGLESEIWPHYVMPNVPRIKMSRYTPDIHMSRWLNLGYGKTHGCGPPQILGCGDGC